MFLQQKNHIHFFNANSDNSGIVISEFGHSQINSRRTVGPWVRDKFIFHFVVNDECVFCSKKVSKGNAFLICKDTIHDFTVDDGYEHFWIAFDGLEAVELLHRFNIPDFNNGIFEIENSDFVSKVFSVAFETGDKKVAQCALVTLLSMVHTDNENNNSMLKYSEMAKVFIDSNYCRKITMQGLAKQLNISEKHMCRVFKKQYLIAPQKYLLKVRMEKAKELLELKNDFKIKEIAYSVGYSSQLAFSEMFLRYFGISPSKCKKDKT